MTPPHFYAVSPQLTGWPHYLTSLFRFHLGLLVLISLIILPCFTVNAENTKNKYTQHKQKQHSEYVRKRFLRLMKQPFKENDESNQATKKQRKILLIGDSHAQDFLNAIVENRFLKNDQIRTRYIPTRCQIYLGSDLQNRWLRTDLALCKKSDNLRLALNQITQADVIILAAFWRKWAAESLSKTIQKLSLTKNQKLFVIGRRSFKKVDQNKSHKLNTRQRRSLRNTVDINQEEINHIMVNTLNKNVFVNVHKTICGAKSNCPAYTDRLKPISFDGGHLSQDGARYFGHQLFYRSQLRQLLKEPLIK